MTCTHGSGDRRGLRWSPAVVAGLIAALAIAAGQAPGALAQAGGAYDLRRSTIAGGAGSASRGSYHVDATIGQADAGAASGGSYFLGSGFWGGIGAVAAATPTPTITGTVASTPTATTSPSPTATASINIAATHTPTTVATNAPTPTVTGAPSPSASPTPAATASPTPSPTATTAPVRGDANCDGRDSAADLPALIHNLGSGERAACGLDDVNDDMHVDDADIEPLIHTIFGEL